jgi:hypothetical protein
MRETTGKWLEPMLLEARLPDIDVVALMTQATMPVVEAGPK